MRIYLTLFIIILSIGYTSAQDQINIKDGRIVEGLIVSIDSSKIYIMSQQYDKENAVSTEISDIKSFKYLGQTYVISEMDTGKLNQIQKSFPIDASNKLFVENRTRLQNHFVYKFNNEVTGYRMVEFFDPAFERAYLRIDKKKADARSIKFYNNDNGFFANTMKLKNSNRPSFSKRVVAGKVNLYEIEKTHYVPGHFGSGGVYMGGYGTKSFKNYYNMGFGDLKEANYRNLSIDLSDNPESLEFLNKYKKVKRAQFGFTSLGIMSIFGGLAVLVRKTSTADLDSKTPPDDTGGIALILAGVGCTWISYTFSLQKPELLRKAVKVYNR